MRGRVAPVVVAVCLAVGWLGWRNGWVVGRASAGRPSILLVSIDTLRADHIGSYGYKVAITPVIDSLFLRRMRFEQAETFTPLALPTQTSFLSGTFSSLHFVRDNVNFYVLDEITT